MTDRPAGTPSEIFALERYYHWADVMRQHFQSQQYEDERRAHWEPYMASWYGVAPKKSSGAFNLHSAD